MSRSKKKGQDGYQMTPNFNNQHPIQARRNIHITDNVLPKNIEDQL